MFVTTDRNLSYQQNLAAIDMAIIVLKAPTNRLADLQPLVSKLLDVLPTAQPGQATLIEG